MQDETTKTDSTETEETGTEKAGEPAQKDTELSRAEEQCGMAALSYLSFLCFIPLFMPGTNEYVAFHLRQGIILFMIGVVASAAAWFSMALWLVLNLLVAAISIYGCFQAFIGRRWEMPVLGEYAKKLRL